MHSDDCYYSKQLWDISVSSICSNYFVLKRSWAQSTELACSISQQQ